MTPNRIVSLVPSLTEALFAFGAVERVVGRTRYCLWPPRLVERVPTVGGTKKVDVRRVLELEPDLIVAVKEENTRENIEALEEASVPVFVGAPESVEGAIELLQELADRVEAPRAGVLEGASALFLALIHRSAWKGCSRKLPGCSEEGPSEMCAGVR